MRDSIIQGPHVILACSWGACLHPEKGKHLNIMATSVQFEDALRSPASLTIRGAGFCGRTSTILTDVFSALSCDYDCTLVVMEDAVTPSWKI